MAIGWDWADPVVGLLITVAILAVLRQAAREIYRRLMDAVDPALVDQAEQTLRATPGVLDAGQVRLRWIGHHLRAECEVIVDADASAVQAHHVAVNAEHNLLHACRGWLRRWCTPTRSPGRAMITTRCWRHTGENARHAEVADPEAARASRLVALWRERLPGREDPQRLAQRVHISGMRIGGRRVQDNLVGRVVGRPDLAAVLGEAPGIRYRYQAEIADQPLAVEFVEIARLDVPVSDAGILLQPDQRAGGRPGQLHELVSRPGRPGTGADGQ